MLTQRTLATYLLERNAHYLFTVKNNQPTLWLDIALQFATMANSKPHFEEEPTYRQPQSTRPPWHQQARPIQESSLSHPTCSETPQPEHDADKSNA